MCRSHAGSIVRNNLALQTSQTRAWRVLSPHTVAPTQREELTVSETSVTRGEAVAAINREREAWDTLLAEVGEDRMLEPGPMGDWTFKDLVAHLTDWRERTLRRLEAAAQGQPEPPAPWPADLEDDDEDKAVDAINAWFQEQSANKLLGEVLDESRASYARLADVVQQLPDAALTDGGYFAWTGGQPLGEAITSGVIFGHLYDEHEAEIRRWLAGRPAETPASGTRTAR